MLKPDSHPPKKFFISFNNSPLKMLKNVFNFILKVLFVLKITKFLSWLFGLCRKTTGLERSGSITIQILPNISRSKGNQARKFGQLMEYNNTIFYFKSHTENEAGRLVPDLFLFSKKALYKVKAIVPQLDFNIFR